MILEHKRMIELFHFEASKLGLKYLIIGGYAASFWGKPRFTADVDYVVAADSFELIKQVMTNLDFHLEFLHPKDAFAHFSHKTTRTLRLDFMLVDHQTWDRLYDSVTKVDFGGAELFPVIGVVPLIAMKLHAAKQPDREDFEKDLTDVVEIMLAQNISFEDLEKLGIIEKYGTEKNIARIKESYSSRIAKRK